MGTFDTNTILRVGARGGDEVSILLEKLQGDFKEQSILNAARKARVTEKLADHLSYQEYAEILEPLDRQVTKTSKPFLTRTWNKFKQEGLYVGATTVSPVNAEPAAATESKAELAVRLMADLSAQPVNFLTARRMKWLKEMAEETDIVPPNKKRAKESDPKIQIPKTVQKAVKERNSWKDTAGSIFDGAPGGLPTESIFKDLSDLVQREREVLEVSENKHEGLGGGGLGNSERVEGKKRKRYD